MIFLNRVLRNIDKILVCHKPDSTRRKLSLYTNKSESLVPFSPKYLASRNTRDLK